MQIKEPKTNAEMEQAYEMAVQSKPQSYVNITLKNGNTIETTAYDVPYDILGVFAVSKKWFTFLTGDGGYAAVRKKDVVTIESLPYRK